MKVRPTVEEQHQDNPASWIVLLLVILCVVVALYAPFFWEYAHG